jgi:hypothetical protein
MTDGEVDRLASKMVLEQYRLEAEERSVKFRKELDDWPKGVPLDIVQFYLQPSWMEPFDVDPLRTMRLRFEEANKKILSAESRS